MHWGTVVLGICAATGAALSGTLWQRLQVEREQHALARARIVELEQAAVVSPPLPTTHDVLAAEPPSLPPASAPISRSAAPAPAVRAAVEPAVVTPQAAFQRMRDMLKDPEYRAAMQQQHRMSMRHAYPDVATALALTPQQTDDFFELLAAQQLRAMETARLGPPADEANQREQLQRLQELQQQNEAELAALLGADKAQAWKDYQRSMGARIQVRELRTLLADTSEPLRSSQAEPFIAALAAEEQRVMGELRNGNADPASMMKRHYETQLRYQERRREIAASYLSPEQQRVFGELIDQQIATLKAQQKLAEAQAANLPPMMPGRFAPMPVPAAGLAIGTSDRAPNLER